MNPDQIVTQIRESLVAAEGWLKAHGYKSDAKKVERHHAALKKIADKYAASGNISALSVGGDKP